MKKAVILVLAAALAVPALAAPSFVTGGVGFADLGSLDKVWDARARGDNTGWEIGVGTDVASGAGNFSNFAWQANTDYDFTFAFSGSTATFTVGNQSVSYSNLDAASDLFLQVKSRNDNSIAFSQVAITNADGSTSGWGLSAYNQVNWIQFGGLDEQDFTMTGKLTGMFDTTNSSERVAFDIVGAVTPVPAPGAILLAGMGVSMVGWLRRRKQV